MRRINPWHCPRSGPDMCALIAPAVGSHWGSRAVSPAEYGQAANIVIEQTALAAAIFTVHPTASPALPPLQPLQNEIPHFHPPHLRRSLQLHPLHSAGPARRINTSPDLPARFPCTSPATWPGERAARSVRLSLVLQLRLPHIARSRHMN